MSNNMLENTKNIVARFLNTPNNHCLDVDIIGPVLEVFDHLSEKHRIAVLQVLASLPSRSAAEAYMAILNLYARSGAVPQLPIQPLRDQPRHANVFFPALLDFIHFPKLRFQICTLLLDYHRAGLIKPELATRIATRLLDAYMHIKTPIMNAQRTVGIVGTVDIWEDTYWLLRRDGSLLLDLMSYFPSPNSPIELRAALTFTDPHLKQAAILSLMRLGVEVDVKQMAQGAGGVEMRNWLDEGLIEVNDYRAKLVA